MRRLLCACNSEGQSRRDTAAHGPFEKALGGCACAVQDVGCAKQGLTRGGAQGCEALIPGMKALIDRSAEAGVESICIGMPHRGARLREAMHCANIPPGSPS